jgi:hypothetical protein
VRRRTIQLRGELGRETSAINLNRLHRIQMMCLLIALLARGEISCSDNSAIKSDEPVFVPSAWVGLRTIGPKKAIVLW